MITGIVLDFGQTLVDSSGGFRRAEKEAQEKIRRDLASADHEEFLRTYREVRESFQRAHDFSRSGMWKEVYGRYGRDVPVTAIREMEVEYWETVKKWTEPFPETERVLAGLAGRYRLAVIS